MNSTDTPLPITPNYGVNFTSQALNATTSDVSPSGPATVTSTEDTVPLISVSQEPSSINSQRPSSLSVAAVEQGQPIYKADGDFNKDALTAVMNEIRGAISTILPKTSASKAVDRKLEAIGAGERPREKIYRDLKEIAKTIKEKSPVAKREQAEALESTLIMMARAENTRIGLSKYDNLADKKSEKILRKNPTIDSKVNSSYTSSHSGAVGGAFKAGMVGAASVGIGANTEVSQSRTVIRDIDHDILGISTRKYKIGIEATADVGNLLGQASAAAVKGGVNGTITRGRLIGATDVKTATRYDLMHQREAGSGDSEVIKSSAKRDRELANVSTHGPAATLNRLKSRIQNYIDPLKDTKPELNTIKIGKGAVPADYLVADQSVLKGHFPQLQRELDSAYGNLPKLNNPASLDPIPYDGKWREKKIGVNVSGSVGSVEVPTIKSTIHALGASGGIDYAYRDLPLNLWLSPNDVIKKLGDGDLKAEWQLLKNIRENDPSTIPYLHSVQGRNGYERNITKLASDINTFEQIGNSLLGANANLLSRDSTEIIKDSATAVFNKNLATLKEVFQLNDDEYKGVKPEGSRDDILKLLARSWNRLSLGLARVRMQNTREGFDTGRIDELNQQINKASILASPSHLYHQAEVQINAAIKRHRTTVQISGDLPKLDLAGLANLATGGVKGTMVYDKVSDHPNPHRNGDIATLKLELSYPSIGKIDVIRKSIPVIAKSIVDRFERDAKLAGFSDAEKAELTGAVEAGLNYDLANDVDIGLSGTKSVSRNFELALHKSSKDEPWRFSYYQPGTNINSTIKAGINLEGEYVMGGKVNVSAQTGTAIERRAIHVIGADAMIHALEFNALKKNMLEPANDDEIMLDQGELLDKRLDFESLKSQGIDKKYFTTLGVLDILNSMAALKRDRSAVADTFGVIAKRSAADKLYDDFKSNGMQAIDLEGGISQAYKDTTKLGPTERLKYFTENENGRALFKEYIKDMDLFGKIKNVASLPIDKNESAYTLNYLTANTTKS